MYEAVGGADASPNQLKASYHLSRHLSSTISGSKAMEVRSQREPLKDGPESAYFFHAPCSSCSEVQRGRDASPNLLSIVSGSEALTGSLSVSAAGPLPMFRVPSPGAADVQRALSFAGTAAPHMGAAVGTAPPADRPWRYNFTPAMPRSPRPTRAQWYAAPATVAGLVPPRPAAAASPTNSAPGNSVCSGVSADTVDDVMCDLKCDLTGFAAGDDVEDDACSAGNTLWMT